MTETSDHVTARPSALPWLVAALAIVLAAGNVYWTNHRIDTLQATAPPPRETGPSDDAKQATAALQQSVQQIESSQQKLGEQIADLQRKIASEGGERKLLSDQLGALSARVDGLASANANAEAAPAAPTTPAAPSAATKSKRGRR